MTLFISLSSVPCWFLLFEISHLDTSLTELSEQYYSAVQKVLLSTALFTDAERYVPKFLDRQVWANSVDPDQRSSLIRVYTVCNSICIF